MYSILTQASNLAQFALDSILLVAQGTSHAGYLLTSFLLRLCSICINSAIYLGQGLSIVGEDFIFFATETLEWVVETLTLFIETTGTCILSLCSLPVSIYSWLASLLVLFKSSMPSVLSQSFTLLIDSVALIGLCVYNVSSMILKGLIYLIEMPHVFLLLLAKQSDTWIAGSSDLADSRSLKVLLGVAFIFSLVVIDIRYELHDKLLEFSNVGSVALVRSLRQTIRITAMAAIVAVGTMCRLGTVSVNAAAKFIRRRPPRNSVEEFGEKLCIICCDRSRSIVLLHCGHLCLCGPCANIVSRDGSCPVCRTEISSMIKVYS